METRTTDANNAAKKVRRRAYRAPEIADFGDVEKLTQGVSTV